MQFLQFVFVTIILLNTLYSLNGIPTSIISNRDDNENLIRKVREISDDSIEEKNGWKELIDGGKEYTAIPVPTTTTTSSTTITTTTNATTTVATTNSSVTTTQPTNTTRKRKEPDFLTRTFGPIFKLFGLN
uniref:Uncharacterized protein n=1 Tax=Strongyloides stercoralis TaxID=6248 RepID=A0A0K0EBH7_STRER